MKWALLVSRFRVKGNISRGFGSNTSKKVNTCSYTYTFCKMSLKELSCVYADWVQPAQDKNK